MISRILLFTENTVSFKLAHIWEIKRDKKNVKLRKNALLCVTLWNTFEKKIFQWFLKCHGKLENDILLKTSFRLRYF